MTAKQIPGPVGPALTDGFEQLLMLVARAVFQSLLFELLLELLQAFAALLLELLIEPDERFALFAPPVREARLVIVLQLFGGLLTLAGPGELILDRLSPSRDDVQHRLVEEAFQQPHQDQKVEYGGSRRGDSGRRRGAQDGSGREGY